MSSGIAFGNYVILKRIWIGAMSEVFMAEDLRAREGRRLVALKRLRPEQAEDASAAASFADEATLIGELSHPYLVALREHGRHEGVSFAAFDYVYGLTLGGLLQARAARRAGPVPWPQAVRWMGCIAECLIALNRLRRADGAALNLVHRDLHPHNLMLSRDGCPKLLDLGIARAEGRPSRTAPGTVKVRLEYAAPEQLRASPADPRTDTYGLALALYEAICGHQPFRRTSPGETMEAVLTSVPTPLRKLCPDVPRELSQCVSDALHKEQSRRPDLPTLRLRLERVLAAEKQIVGLLELADLIAADLPGANRLVEVRSDSAVTVPQTASLSPARGKP